MEREDQRGILRNDEIVRCHADSQSLYLFDFLNQRPGINNDAVSQNREFSVTYNS